MTSFTDDIQYELSYAAHEADLDRLDRQDNEEASLFASQPEEEENAQVDPFGLSYAQCMAASPLQFVGVAPQTAGFIDVDEDPFAPFDSADVKGFRLRWMAGIGGMRVAR